MAGLIYTPSCVHVGLGLIQSVRQGILGRAFRESHAIDLYHRLNSIESMSKAELVRGLSTTFPPTKIDVLLSYKHGHN